MSPAWSWGSESDALLIERSPLFQAVTREAAFGGATGAGVRVGIVDSGIDADHPEVGGAVRGWVEPLVAEDGTATFNLERHGDLFGHGTACAGVVHQIAPEAELYSIRVLGAGLAGRGTVLAAGLRWAIENGMDVVNLSLGTTKRDYFAQFHELVDDAYFRRVMLVTAANNMPILSFPSLYATVVSVACYRGVSGEQPLDYYCNPSPPVEFGALGINVRLAWMSGGYITATGNSFAAPHITGIIALLRSKHPHLTPFEVKAVLRALACNVRSP